MRNGPCLPQSLPKPEHSPFPIPLRSTSKGIGHWRVRGKSFHRSIQAVQDTLALMQLPLLDRVSHAHTQPKIRPTKSRKSCSDALSRHVQFLTAIAQRPSMWKSPVLNTPQRTAWQTKLCQRAQVSLERLQPAKQLAPHTKRSAREHGTQKAS